MDGDAIAVPFDLEGPVVFTGRAALKLREAGLNPLCHCIREMIPLGVSPSYYRALDDFQPPARI